MKQLVAASRPLRRSTRAARATHALRATFDVHSSSVPAMCPRVSVRCDDHGVARRIFHAVEAWGSRGERNQPEIQPTLTNGKTSGKTGQGREAMGCERAHTFEVKGLRRWLGAGERRG